MTAALAGAPLDDHYFECRVYREPPMQWTLDYWASCPRNPTVAIGTGQANHVQGYTMHWGGRMLTETGVWSA